MVPLHAEIARNFTNIAPNAVDFFLELLCRAFVQDPQMAPSILADDEGRGGRSGNAVEVIHISILEPIGGFGDGIQHVMKLSASEVELEEDVEPVQNRQAARPASVDDRLGEVHFVDFAFSFQRVRIDGSSETRVDFRCTEQVRVCIRNVRLNSMDPISL